MFSGLTDALSIYTIYDLALVVVDFLLVYLLIYQGLMLIRGTRAVQMLTGLLLILAVYFFSSDEYLGLTTVHWILEQFIASAILVIVVLFQDDIRRGLLKFGRSRIFSGLSSSEEAYVVEELVRASSMLAQRRIGALIAIERDADLTEYTEEGIRLDTFITKESLFAVFNPANANPLHDGAVIVRGDRLVAAGCFLPLTSNPRLDKSLGTRHRAAIGLSEDTDALVLVVSEETGIVSVAMRGQLTRRLEGNELRQLLQQELGSARKKTNPSVGATA